MSCVITKSKVNKIVSPQNLKKIHDDIFISVDTKSDILKLLC